MLIIKILYGIFILTSGVLMIKFRKKVHSWTGNFVWAEKYLGSGGTHLFILILGLFLIFLGVIYPFGGLDLIAGK